MRPLGLWAPARLVVGRMARVAAVRRTQEQGFGWLSPAEKLALVREELGALSALLAERPFLFGARPHAVDAAAFGVLDQMAAAALNPQLAALVGEHANLVRGCCGRGRAGGGLGERGCCRLWRSARGMKSWSPHRAAMQVAYRDRIRSTFFGEEQQEGGAGAAPASSPAVPAGASKDAAGPGSPKKEE